MPPLATLESSSNGMAYYRSETFGGAAKGNIFVAKYGLKGYMTRWGPGGCDALVSRLLSSLGLVHLLLVSYSRVCV